MLHDRVEPVERIDTDNKTICELATDVLAITGWLQNIHGTSSS